MTTNNKLILIGSAVLFIAGLTFFLIDKKKVGDKDSNTKK